MQLPENASPLPSPPADSTDSDRLAEALSRDYRVIAHLQSDELGIVFVAEQIRVGGRRVALRVFHPAVCQSPEARARLEAGFAAVSRLKDPHVAALYECGDVPGGRMYVATEFVEGESVGRRLREHGPLPPDEVVTIVEQCAKVLDASTRLGITDCEPSLDRMVMTRNTEGVIPVKLIDFGFPMGPLVGPGAGVADRDPAARPAAPDADSPRKPHVSSLARAAYAMLTGRLTPPLGAWNDASDAQSITPLAVGMVLMSALEAGGEGRYATAVELAAALRRSLTAGPTSSSPLAPAAEPVPTPPVVRSPAPKGGTPVEPRPGGGRKVTRQRPLGELLLVEGILSESQLEAALHAQAEQSPTTPLGQILIDQHMVTPTQLNRVLAKYRKQDRLGDLLVETNTITEEQLARALEQQKKTGLRLGELLLKFDYVSELSLRRALCTQLMVSLIDLDAVAIDQHLGHVVNKHYAQRHRLLPVARTGNRLTVAMDDPTDGEVIEELEASTGCEIDVATSTAASFERALVRLYGESIPEHAARHSEAALLAESRNQRSGEASTPPPSLGVPGVVGRLAAPRGEGAERARVGSEADHLAPHTPVVAGVSHHPEAQHPSEAARLLAAAQGERDTLRAAQEITSRAVRAIESRQAEMVERLAALQAECEALRNAHEATVQGLRDLDVRHAEIARASAGLQSGPDDPRREMKGALRGIEDVERRTGAVTRQLDEIQARLSTLLEDFARAERRLDEQQACSRVLFERQEALASALASVVRRLRGEESGGPAS